VLIVDLRILASTILEYVAQLSSGLVFLQAVFLTKALLESGQIKMALEFKSGILALFRR
jgi:hypothetical protein